MKCVCCLGEDCKIGQNQAWNVPQKMYKLKMPQRLSRAWLEGNTQSQTKVCPVQEFIEARVFVVHIGGGSLHQSCRALLAVCCGHWVLTLPSTPCRAPTAGTAGAPDAGGQRPWSPGGASAPEEPPSWAAAGGGASPGEAEGAEAEKEKQKSQDSVKWCVIHHLSVTYCRANLGRQ